MTKKEIEIKSDTKMIPNRLEELEEKYKLKSNNMIDI